MWIKKNVFIESRSILEINKSVKKIGKYLIKKTKIFSQNSEINIRIFVKLEKTI